MAVLYLKLQKTLYGLMKASLLFYQKFQKELEEYGFMVYPYDPCVANKVINGTHMTICWHVGNLKASNVDPGERSQYLETG